jgi:orotate phosphoribosyltransferase
MANARDLMMVYGPQPYGPQPDIIPLCDGAGEVVACGAQVSHVKPGARVVIVDDLLATGGTVAAAIDLCHRLGATVLACAFLVELRFLNGRERLSGIPVFAPVEVSGE